MEYQLAIIVSWASWLLAVGAYETTKAAGQRVGEEVGDMISDAIHRLFNGTPPPNVTDATMLQNLAKANAQGTNRPLLEQVERETVTVLTRMLSDVTRLHLEDMQTIYREIGMLASKGRPFVAFFGPRDNRPEIASEIVLWARSQGKLDQLVKLTRAQNEYRA